MHTLPFLSLSLYPAGHTTPPTSVSKSAHYVDRWGGQAWGRFLGMSNLRALQAFPVAALIGAALIENSEHNYT